MSAAEPWRPAGAALGVAVALCVASATTASAQDEQGAPVVTDEPAAAPRDLIDTRPRSYAVELGAALAYLTGPVRGATSPFGAGFGARFGIDFSGVYVGARILAFLGGTDVDLSYRSLLYGVEGGYSFRVLSFAGTKLVLRPTLGVGDVAVSFTNPSQTTVDVVSSASGSSTSSSDTITVNNVYLEPSLTAMLESQSHFAAVRAVTLVIPGISPYGTSDATTWISYGLEAQLGFRF